MSGFYTIIYGRQHLFEPEDRNKISVGFDHYRSVFKLEDSSRWGNHVFDWKHVCHLAGLSKSMDVIVRQWIFGEMLDPNSGTCFERMFFKTKKEEDVALIKCLLYDIVNLESKTMLTEEYWKDLADLISEPNWFGLYKRCMNIEEVGIKLQEAVERRNVDKLPMLDCNRHYFERHDLTTLKQRRKRIVLYEMKQWSAIENKIKQKSTTNANAAGLTDDKIMSVLEDLSDSEVNMDAGQSWYNDLIQSDAHFSSGHAQNNYHLMHTKRKLTDEEWESIFDVIKNKMWSGFVTNIPTWDRIIEHAGIKTSRTGESIMADYFSIALPNADRILPLFNNPRHIQADLRDAERPFALLVFHSYLKDNILPTIPNLYFDNMLSDEIPVLKWTLLFAEKLLKENCAYFGCDKDLFNSTRLSFLKYVFKEYLPQAWDEKHYDHQVTPLDVKKWKEWAKSMSVEYEILAKIQHIEMEDLGLDEVQNI